LNNLAEFEGDPPDITENQVDTINLKIEKDGNSIFSLAPDATGQLLKIQKKGRQLRHFDRETGIENEPFLRISFDFELESASDNGKIAAIIVGDSLTPNSQIPGVDERWAQVGIYAESGSFYLTNEIIRNKVVHRSASYGGRERVSIFLNNSQGQVQYIGPDDSFVDLDPLQVHVWVGDEFVIESLAYSGVSAEINMVKFLLWLNDVNATAVLDNLVITDNLNLDPLPVNLVSFAVKQAKEHIALAWQTSWEKNNSHFEVQRSKDGAHFTTIGQVAGQGTSTQLHNYTFADKEGPEQGAAMLYYRLKQVDFDGAFEYSPVRVLMLPHKAFSITEVGPNPFDQQLNIQINSPASEHLQIRLINSQGQTVLEKRMFMEAGTDEKTIQLNNSGKLEAGLYLVEVRSAKSREIIRLLKQ
jgi:hypothetical protein